MPAQVHADDDVFFHIVRVQFQLQTQPIQLIVQSTDGSHFSATLPYFSKGKELSSVVEAKLGMPHGQQLLMCQQKWPPPTTVIITTFNLGYTVVEGRYEQHL